VPSARDFRVQEPLRNGLVVEVRAARPEDRERIATAFSKLERETVYLRFFSHRSELSATELARLDNLDFVHDIMLVVTLSTQDGEIVIGSGRCIQLEAAPIRSAEVAFVVEEDYQGLGIAGRVLKHLVTLARAASIQWLEADVLSENKAMLAVFARSGLPMRKQRAGGVVHVTLDLSGEKAR